MTTPLIAPCPHCQQETHGTSHFRRESRAARDGETLCPRAGMVLSAQYADRFGWACPPGHECYLTRRPAVADARADDLEPIEE